jgi:hypothetical protein
MLYMNFRINRITAKDSLIFNDVKLHEQTFGKEKVFTAAKSTNEFDLIIDLPNTILLRKQNSKVSYKEH